MRNVIVSVGRNIGSSPMHSDDWNAFRLDICSLFPQRIFTGTGIGSYEGVTEESFTVIAPYDTGDWHMESSPALRLQYVKAVLKTYAQKYGQECIAVTLGEPDLVTP